MSRIRRLVMILAADVAGHSRLMGQTTKAGSNAAKIGVESAPPAAAPYAAGRPRFPRCGP
jgi:hypothetical protein